MSAFIYDHKEGVVEVTYKNLGYEPADKDVLLHLKAVRRLLGFARQEVNCRIMSIKKLRERQGRA